MKVICHIYDVVDDVAYVFDGEAFEVPVRCRGGNTDRLTVGDGIPDKLEELEISQPVVLITGGDTGDVRGAWVGRRVSYRL